MNAAEIQKEAERTNTRIEELESQHDEQASAFEAAQKAFVAGKGDVDRLHAEQGKLTLISQAIESLRATAHKLATTFKGQSEVESRHQIIQTMTAAANDVEPLLDDYLKTRNEFNDLVSKYAEALIEKAQAYRNKQSTFQTLLGGLDPKPSNSELQISDNARRLASATYFNHPPIEYGEVVGLAETMLAAKINKADQAKRQAEYHARSVELRKAG